MTSTELPPLDFGDAGLRISLSPFGGLASPPTLDQPAKSELTIAEPRTAELDASPAGSNPTTTSTSENARAAPSSPPRSTKEDVASAPPPPPRNVRRVAARDSIPPVPASPPKPARRDKTRRETWKEVAPTFPQPVQNVPMHPIPSMQEAFAESLEESTGGHADHKPKLRALDAAGRRDRLLEQGQDETPFDAHWRYRPGQTQHEVIKLISQISFGVYLLLKGMANSNAQVVTILQGHIDEVDEFLEVTLEDLSQASQDLNGRIEHLKVPLTNLQAFEQLLEDRNFRIEILEGNEKIDHVLRRTNAALRQWEDDIDSGMRSTAAFTNYLLEEEHASWRTERPDVADIFDAMKGNMDGWIGAFEDMSQRAQEANNVIGRLSTIISEMEKKAGEVSRRTRGSIEPFSAPMYKPQSRGSTSVRSGQSSARPKHQLTSGMRSMSASTNRSNGSMQVMEDEFPLPGMLPLLPPLKTGHHQLKSPTVDAPRSAAALKNPFGADTPPETPKPWKSDSSSHSEKETGGDGASTASEATQSKAEQTVAATTPPADDDKEVHPPATQSRDSQSQTAIAKPLYLLQPRTYSPVSRTLSPQSSRAYSPAQESTASPLLRTAPAASSLSAAASRTSLRLAKSREELVISKGSPRPNGSPRVNGSPHLNGEAESAGSVRPTSSHTSLTQKRASIRHRASMKKAPPGAIQIPPRPTPNQRLASETGTPQTGRSNPFDSDRGSETSSFAPARHRNGSFGSDATPTAPTFRESPQSDNHQQYYHPVRASPHSALQQRPHTAATVQPRPQYLRNKPSAIGGMSTLSNVSYATYNHSQAPSRAKSVATSRQTKKKKGPFGWLKQAFSLDEEEKAAFEARKAAQHQQQYYDRNSPKFLDGRRIR